MSCNTGTPNVNKTFIIEPQSTTGGTPVLSACTALYTNQIIACTGDTITFGNNIYVDGSVSGNTYFGDGSNLTGIDFSGNTSGNCITDLWLSNLYGCSPITIHDDLLPFTDNTQKLGTPVKRFRSINTYSGTTSIWSATTRVITPSLELGLDSLNNVRTINANNSIIQDDTLIGGSY